MKLIKLSSVSNEPKNIPSRLAHLKPQIFSEHVVVEIADCNAAMKQSLIRAMSSEILSNYLLCEQHDIHTDDNHIIAELVVARFRMVPLMQNIPVDTTFSMNVVNNTASVMAVHMKHVVPSNPKITAFNGNIILLHLKAGCSIKIPKIAIDQKMPFMPGYGMISLCCGVGSRSLDVDASNAYDPVEGTLKTEVADPKKWAIEFDTNGTIPAKQLLKIGCESLITRLTDIKDQLHTISSKDGISTLTVVGESDTISNLLQKTICVRHPTVNGVSVHVPLTSRMFSLHLSYQGDAESVLVDCIEHLISQYKEFMAMIR